MAGEPTKRSASVVVVGEGLNCLGIIRSLSSAGVRVVAVTTRRRCAVSCSRLATVVQIPSLEGAELVSGLQSMARGLGERPVLMLGGDRQVAAVSAAREALEPFYRIAMPAAGVVQMLADKASFQAFAEERGLPVPRTVVIDTQESLARLATLALPIVLKPADKAKVLDGRVDRVLQVRTLAEAEAAAARMTLAAGPVVAQEWIDGNDSDIYFALFVCDRDSRLLGMFGGRKLVCSPPAVGNTAVCAPAGEESDAVCRLAARFVGEVRYRGIGGIEFKRDAHSGRLLIVEPTVARTDWQSEVASLNGVNLPLIAYYEALDLPLPPGLGVPWAGPAGPAHPTAWCASWPIRHPRAGRGARLRFRDGYFRLSDPLPGLYHYLFEEFGRRLVRRSARMARMAHLVRRAPEPLVKVPPSAGAVPRHD